MQNIVRAFVHQTGQHCGSSAVSRLLRFYGHNYSEPMCLGLGQGPDFVYLADPTMSPTHWWMGRGALLEIDCFAALGVTCEIRRTRDDAEGWRWVKDEIDAGRPALIGVDIRWLDYYRTQTHFAGHRVLVVGYDEDKQTALLSDNEFAEMQELPLASLARARRADGLPFQLENDWFDVRVPPRLTPLAQATPATIAAMARRMLSDRGPSFGVAALAAAAADLPRWGAAPDWQWCARFAYQVIEKRGTGGGFFRKMYAAFLREAAPHCADIVRLGLAERMAEIAAGWTQLAQRLRAVSEAPSPSGFDEAAALLADVAGRERACCEAAARCACAAPQRA
jgi:hypothetical protein